jgi:hypothetical protein
MQTVSTALRNEKHAANDEVRECRDGCHLARAHQFRYLFDKVIGNGLLRVSPTLQKIASSDA